MKINQKSRYNIHKYIQSEKLNIAKCRVIVIFLNLIIPRHIDNVVINTFKKYSGIDISFLCKTNWFGMFEFIKYTDISILFNIVLIQ